MKISDSFLLRGLISLGILALLLPCTVTLCVFCGALLAFLGNPVGTWILLITCFVLVIFWLLILISLLLLLTYRAIAEIHAAQKIEEFEME